MTLRKKSLALGSAATFASGATGALLLALAAAPAGATPQNYVVDDLSDGASNPLDCRTPVANSCSLRDALDAVVNGDTITFASGLTGTITLTRGELEIKSEILIQGPGASNLTIDGNQNSRVFYLFSGSPNTEIAGVTITGGSARKGGGLYDEGGDGFVLRDVVVTGNAATSRDGGGLYSSGPVRLINTTVSNNTAFSDGGGVKASGGLTMTDSTISGNSAAHGGGGVHAGGDVSISNSTFDANTANSCGGGLYQYGNGATVEILNSTFSNNVADSCYGGGIDIDGNYGTVTIANTTITGNSAQTGGGLHVSYGNTVYLFMDTISGNDAVSTDPLYSGGGVHLGNQLGFTPTTLQLVGTIVSGNTAVAGPADIGYGYASSISATVYSEYSLLGDVDSRITIFGGDNVTSTTPGLGALANNGGPTRTMAVLAGSPALDVGPGVVPLFATNACDQRGPGYARVVAGRADIGAFEFGAGPAPEPTTTTTASSDPVVPAFTG